MRDRWSGINVNASNPVVCGRKYCAGCGRWRHAVDFRPRTDKHVPSSSCEPCRRAARRARYARWTPEQMERKREYARFWLEKHRRETGGKARPFKNRRTVVDRAERIFLPREPLLKEITIYMRQHSVYSMNGELTAYQWRELAQLAGVNERSLYRLRHEDGGHVRIDLADRLAVTIGVPLSLIYPADTPARRL
jgi:hypothetical protein